MTQLTRSEVGLNLSYGFHRNNAYFNNGTPYVAALESTKLNALDMVLTDGGRWAFGLGYYTPVSFDDPLFYQSSGGQYSYDASGQMDHYRMGLAYMVNEQVRLGLAVTAVSGKE